MNLLKRPQIIVANKMDLPNAEDNLEKFKKQLTDEFPIIPISAITKDNLNEMLYKIADILETAPYISIYEEDEFYENRYLELEDDKPKFEINLDDDGIYSYW